ncbi:hypothetical protein D1159_12650 [Pseudoflavonifractor sp. 524-17]|uniref:hypothetical protein n=1 Tax=Pseudoflavonifractor sp. 524-17 TaxID=2304577 RepID=UPI00137A668F|nr:hypothetical protein [Pseudoflavonifractor sp. 524-17]NCE65403.1 hypothetical protein [Pseudoflavonifractor sp. 524-17]
MAGIRVNTGAKRIEVNDNGDYITLNFGDQSFPDRFFTTMDKIQEFAKEADPQEKEIRAQHEAGSESLNRALFALYKDVHLRISAEVDHLFGPDTCKKVFGDIVPGIELFDDFFTQLMPYFEEFSKERAQRMSKYSADRMGNV